MLRQVVFSADLHSANTDLIASETQLGEIGDFFAAVPPGFGVSPYVFRVRTAEGLSARLRFCDTNAQTSPTEISGDGNITDISQGSHMRSSATARRSSSSQSDDVIQTQAQIDHWLFDCEQLARWQSDLMTYCRAINRQLTQIHSGLNALPIPGSEDNNVVSLRIVAEHDRVWP